jgi:hypothetical protein
MAEETPMRFATVRFARGRDAARTRDRALARVIRLAAAPTRSRSSSAERADARISFRRAAQGSHSIQRATPRIIRHAAGAGRALARERAQPVVFAGIPPEDLEMLTVIAHALFP